MTPPRFDSYTGLELRSAPWMLNPPGQRMPFAAGRHCTNPDCHKELSRYDRGPSCWSCYQREQAKAKAEALADAGLLDAAQGEEAAA